MGLFDERNYSAEVVKVQVLFHAKCGLAISLWNDAEANALAENLGGRSSRQSPTLFGTHSSDKAVLYQGPTVRRW